MNISLFHLFILGAIVLFVFVPMLKSLATSHHWAHPGAILTTGAVLVLLFFVFFGLRVQVQRTAVQNSVATSYAPPNSQSYYVSSPMTPNAAFALTWRMMLILSFGVPVILLGLRFAHRRHWHMHLGRHGLFGLPLALIALGLFFWTVRTTSFESPAPQVARQVERKAPWPSPYPGAIPVSAQSESRKSQISAEKVESTSAAANEAPSQPAENPEPEKAAPAENLPDWVHDSRQVKDDVYYEVVPLLGIVDPNIRTELMNDKLKAVMNHYIDDVLFHEQGASSAINISPEYLREKCKGGEFESRSGSGDAYFRLKFDKDFRGLVERQYRAFIAQDHLQQLGAAGLGAFAALGGLYVFLRATPNAGGKSANAEAAVPDSTT